MVISDESKRIKELALELKQDREWQGQRELALELRQDREWQEQEARKCPYCKEIIKKDAIVCRFCGRDLEPEHSNDLIPEMNIAPTITQTIFPSMVKVTGEWYYVDNNRSTVGPFKNEVLHGLVKTEVLTPDTLVWSAANNVNDWAKASETELKKLFSPVHNTSFADKTEVA
jgi:hypothetical protein